MWQIDRGAGKPMVVSQEYVGSPEREAAMAHSQEQEDIELRVEKYGALRLI